MLISNDKKMLSIFVMSAIIGFSFLLTVTSLSETIIKTKQDNTVKTYGRFLVVIPDIDEETEENIKSQCDQFTYEYFGMIGNVKYDDKDIAIGTMKEDMGKNLGFSLIKGKWPQTSNQIVVEEYLLNMFGIENKQIPYYISLQNGKNTVNYEITGVISNYSSMLSTSTDAYSQMKPYPSIICGGENVQNVKKSLVILQKTIDFKNARDDIDTILSEISADNMCINEKLYARGYKDNEDIIYTRVVYIILLNFLLLLEHIVMIRAFLLRNKNTFLLLRALGLSLRRERKVIFALIQGLIWFGLITGYILSLLTAKIYINNVFQEYNKFYISALHRNVLIEAVIVAVVLSGTYFLYDGIKFVIRQDKEKLKNNKKYKFKKLDFSIIIIQAVCIFFTMTSFYCMNIFEYESEGINFDLYSKRDTVSYPLNGYNIAAYGNNYFSFDDFDEFSEFSDEISLSAEAETKQSTILLEKDKTDDYFKNYIEDNNWELSPKDKALWRQVSDKAEQYSVIPANEVKIIVLKQKDFDIFLNKYKIINPVLEKNTENTCVLLLPNYKKVSSDSPIKKNETLQFGGIKGDENKVQFCTESFKIGALIGCDEEESSYIRVVMSEKTAQKSKTVVGYDTIRIAMKEDTPVSIQKDIEEKISLLMAEIQGGMLDSSGLRADRDKVLKNYTSIMSNTMLVLGIIAVWIYIVFSMYIDWEKHSHEYGVLRSMGMSYTTLQSKMFFRYSNSIIFACIFSLFLGRYLFANDFLTGKQVIFSIGLTVGVTYFCRLFVFCLKKKQSISSMINRTNGH